ncbi:Trypsin domain protein [Coleofasciculus chthonoplastes PCC 7420]|uniref:Trypsin domain protein n=1 Tax=Coleofasciculus chthonoplastes PCC 7420 TaxID=118168 RepID=B4VYT3_9CYAN|nr:HhoA/HhoB/HtrA family serine endopeptidase [Coleofasciculus chthonoplastes]EDX72877.1 Trypsin domain protein [Coleofasciculus chthonoplastes PCC 7420]
MVLNTKTSQSHDSDASPVKKAVTYLSLMLLGAGVSFGANSFISGNPQVSANSIVPQSSQVLGGIIPPANLSTPQNSNFITKVVDTVGPAVVRINASKTVTSQVPDAFNNPFFREFFGSQLPEQPQQRVERGTGSGFIINTDGMILTNAHVVDGADQVNVVLKDGRTFAGKVLGTDPVTDVAVIKVEADNLPIVTLGDSEQLKPGEWAIAIGNPLGLDNTVTTGIISATGRSSAEIGVPDKRVQFIQTDAAINPGNSGGPLLNASGEVIGMNTAIIQGAQGLGFSIPINTAQRIAQQLIANGKVEHPFLGIQMVTLTPELKENINKNPNSGLTVDESQGVLIARVMRNSPADKAGLRAGDVIHKINGESIKDAEDVQKVVEMTPVGSDLNLELRRDRKNVEVTVQPGALPTQMQQ